LINLIKVHAVIGVLGDDTDPMVTVMKLEKAPQETYADIGGLDQQIQEIKESVELPLTHPEYYEEMGIRPPKGVILYGPPGTGIFFNYEQIKNIMKIYLFFLYLIFKEKHYSLKQLLIKPQLLFCV
jgi:ATP-dependent 26S proteasome regulatory subunit